MHPIINQIGSTRKTGLSRKKRTLLRRKALWKKFVIKPNHRWSTIGSMEHLDTATLEDFKDFHKKILHPNNAVLVVAGDFEKKTKQKDRKILWPIEKGRSTKKQTFIEEPITQTIKATYIDLTFKYRWLLLQDTFNKEMRDARVF
jgi:predicted Zn-dependent peptidase